jgi:tryptophan synthase alpha chain
MRALVEAGVDIIELGIPFSDPMAEGPVIQKAHERALVHKASLRSTLALVKNFREENTKTPIVLMGYANPIERLGYANFAKAAADAGVDGVLTVDLPPEEAKELDAELQSYGLENIFLVAPTTTDARIEEIAKVARGFIYYVSLKGVTGASNLDIESVEQNVARIKAKSSLPVQVGFGIKDADSAKQVSECSEGVVVGSALVKLMTDSDESVESICQKLSGLLKPMRTVLD